MAPSFSKEFFDALAPHRDAWKRKNRYYYEYIEEKLIPFLVPSDATVLEVGCGTGDLLAKLNPTRGVGIDVSEKMMVVARAKYQKSNLEFLRRDPDELNERFDYCVLSDVIGFADDVEGLFRALRRLTHEKSRLVITQYSTLWEPVLKLGSRLGMRMPDCPQNWLSREDIELFLALAGFEVVSQGSKILFPLYIPFLSWCMNRIFANIPLVQRLNLVNYFVARPAPKETVLAVSDGMRHPHEPSVSIIVPARNEAGTIEVMARELPHLGSSTEIIFVEGHSRDTTLAEIRRVVGTYRGSKLLRYAVQEGEGKGDAVRKGFSMARGEVLIIYDADMTVPPQELEKFYRALVEGKGDFINGSRLIYPMERQSMRTLNLIANKLFSKLLTWLLGQRVKDTLCGTKVLWKNGYEAIARHRAFFGEFDPFGDFDLLFGAAKLHFKIIDMPIHYRERTYGATNIRRWKHGWLLLKMCWFAARKLKFSP